jgi:hypothetical protein
VAFKIQKKSSVSGEDPESMFRDIKTKKIAGPLADQADLWRAYSEQAIGAADVALQLPTGGGKTLVGIVLGEWRRLKFKERVVILCPTRQLVNQVAAQSRTQYGIPVLAFTGSKAAYESEAKFQYQNCERVAVTTYSSLFNSAPFFADPNVVILDDAHAAEQYISAMWSLEIDRQEPEQRPAYDALVAILKSELSPSDYLRLAHEERIAQGHSWVDKLPTPSLHKLIPEILPLLDSLHTGCKDHRFVWPAIRDQLFACHLYLAAGRILIRPLLAPTHVHEPFVGARQRIYMSATFGEAGELERVTGRSPILRLRPPRAQERQTVGRRYFLFPERSLEEEKQRFLCEQLIKKSGRALVLTPDERRAREFREFVNEKLHCEVFSALDIEHSKDKFVSSPRAVAVVANRYDGIDFPGDECRLLLIEGLPRATNLQERFLVERMGAVDLLNVRISTRLIQAFGRCTRSDEDYAAVVVRGEELNKHLLTPERRALFPTELQAEVNFGLEQSKEMSVSDYTDNFKILLAQGEEWSAANAEIINQRDHLALLAFAGAADLAESAAPEIDYLKALWAGDFAEALARAREVLTRLKSPALRGYRALWHYLAGSAAWLASRSDLPELESVAREQFAAATKAERAVPWLIPLQRLAGGEEGEKTQPEDLSVWSVIERMEAMFSELGTLQDHRYTAMETLIRKGLAEKDASAFEQAQVNLGRLLGYDSGKDSKPGAPDPWWRANRDLCFVFEDHSNAQTASALSVDKARQVCTHPNWVREHLDVVNDATIIAVLVSPVSTADPGALTHLKDISFWPIDHFRSWAENALSVVRELRRDYPGAGDLAWRARAVSKLEAASLTPAALAKKLRTMGAARALAAKAT